MRTEEATQQRGPQLARIETNPGQTRYGRKICAKMVGRRVRKIFRRRFLDKTFEGLSGQSKQEDEAEQRSTTTRRKL